MPVTKIANFSVSDFSSDTTFVLDTNVLYFIHSGYYMPSNAQSIAYSNVVQEILKSNHKIVISVITIQELLYGIENKEYELYLKSIGKKRHEYTKKDYRKNIPERQKLSIKMQTILTELSIYEQVDAKICGGPLQQYVKKLTMHAYDPIDYILVDNFCSKDNIVFISNDKDFEHDTNISLITM